MKQIIKTLLLMLGVLSTAGTTSAQTVDFQQEIKEMSYALGLVQTQGLDEYLTSGQEIDLAHKETFIKGVVEVAERPNTSESAAYYAGIQIGVQICTRMITGINKELFGDNSEQSISLKDFLNGFVAGVKGVSEEEMNKASETATDKIQKIKAIMLEKELGK